MSYTIQAKAASSPLGNLSIDRASPVPFYIQLQEILRRQIERGELRPGDQMPAESTLCQDFDVSRTVVRQAFNDLTNEGLVVRKRGKGTFVAEKKIIESLVQRLTGFHQDMIERGLTPVSRVLTQRVIPANEKVASNLGVSVGTPVIELERLRSVEDEPIVLVTTYLPQSFCPYLAQADMSHQSLYVYLEQSCGLVIARGRRAIEAVPAKEYEAGLLQVPKGSPLVLLVSVSYLSDGTPIEYYHALHRGDRSRFEVELVRMREQGGTRAAIGGEPSDLPGGSVLTS